jgi:hypothetical protein
MRKTICFYNHVHQLKSPWGIATQGSAALFTTNHEILFHEFQLGKTVVALRSIGRQKGN